MFGSVSEKKKKLMILLK